MLAKFYPIVPDAEWAGRLARLGVKLIQLRMKDAAAAAIPDAIARALAVCRASGCELVVNDYWREAIDCGAGFVHLGQGDLETADTVALRRAGIKLGISTHSHEELERALRRRSRLCGARPDLRNEAQGHAMGAAGIGADFRMESARQTPARRHRIAIAPDCADSIANAALPAHSAPWRARSAAARECTPRCASGLPAQCAKRSCTSSRRRW